MLSLHYYINNYNMVLLEEDNAWVAPNMVHKQHAGNFQLNPQVIKYNATSSCPLLMHHYTLLTFHTKFLQLICFTFPPISLHTL